MTVFMPRSRAFPIRYRSAPYVHGDQPPVRSPCLHPPTPRSPALPARARSSAGPSTTPVFRSAARAASWAVPACAPTTSTDPRRRRRGHGIAHRRSRLSRRSTGPPGRILRPMGSAGDESRRWRSPHSPSSIAARRSRNSSSGSPITAPTLRPAVAAEAPRRSRVARSRPGRAGRPTRRVRADELGAARRRSRFIGGRGGPDADLERMRTDFLSIIAHELRTPITVMRTLTGLLLDPASEPTDEQRRTMLETMERNAERMQRPHRRDPRPRPLSRSGPSDSSFARSMRPSLQSRLWRRSARWPRARDQTVELDLPRGRRTARVRRPRRASIGRC